MILVIPLWAGAIAQFGLKGFESRVRLFGVCFRGEDFGRISALGIVVQMGEIIIQSWLVVPQYLVYTNGLRGCRSISAFRRTANL